MWCRLVPAWGQLSEGPGRMPRGLSSLPADRGPLKASRQTWPEATLIIPPGWIILEQLCHLDIRKCADSRILVRCPLGTKGKSPFLWVWMGFPLKGMGVPTISHDPGPGGSNCELGRTALGSPRGKPFLVLGALWAEKPGPWGERISPVYSHCGRLS